MGYWIWLGRLFFHSIFSYQKFVEIISYMVDCFFPVKQTKIKQSYNPWMTSSLKLAITKKSLHKYGEESDTYTFWRNKGQPDVYISSQ